MLVDDEIIFNQSESFKNVMCINRYNNEKCIVVSDNNIFIYNIISGISTKIK